MSTPTCQIGIVRNRSPTYAPRNGYEGVVEILLGPEVVNPDKPGNFNAALICLLVDMGYV